MDNKVYLGVDIGGTAAKIGLVNGQGQLLVSDNVSVNFDGYQTPILTTVLSGCESFIKRVLRPYQTLLGIGISATGQIDMQTGCVAGTGGNILGWSGTPLQTAFQEKFKVPVTVINDANSVALGEQWVGAAQGLQNVVVITVGTGLGGGILSNGQLLTGHRGLGGEIGHLPIQSVSPLRQCTCGNFGCYEQYGSVTALVRQVKEWVKTADPDLIATLFPNGIVSGWTIFHALDETTLELNQIVQNWIEDLATGLVGLIHLLNPECVLVGGAVSQQEEKLILPLRKRVLSRVMENFRQGLEIKATALGNQAGLIGAVGYFIQVHHP